MNDDNESTTATTTTAIITARHHHHHLVCSTSRIGVLEFAALLNTTTATTTSQCEEEKEEDGLSIRQWEVLWHARNILYALRRFIVTIRRDRYQATVTTAAAAATTTTTTIMDDWYIRDVLDEDDFLLRNVPWLDKNQQQQEKEDDKGSTGIEEDEAIPMKAGKGFDGGRHTGNSSSDSLTQATTATTSTNVLQEQPPQRAKKKKQRINHESWKDDIASYNVPFVGTSTRATYTTLATVTTTATTTSTTNSIHSTIPPNVQMGVWPTGLLYDYLQKSPLAMELLRDDNTWMPPPQSGGRSSTTNTTSPSQTRTPITTWTNNSNNIHTLLWKQSRHGSNNNNNSSSKKKNKSSSSSDDTMERYSRALSQAIGKAYLQALSELITAALPPVQQLRRSSLLPPPPHCIRNSSHATTTTATPTTYLPTSQIPRFVPDLLTHRLSGLLQLLVDDIGLPGMRTAGTHSNQDHFHIRPAGVWVAPILTICTRLASISVPIARQIARCIEQTIPQPIVRYLFTYPPPSSSSSSSSVLQETNHPHPSAPEQPSNNHTPVVTRVVSPRMKAYVAAIHFLTTLVDIDDSVIFSCISSNNSHTGSNAEHTHTKQQQTKPTKSGGILFWALQRGLPSTAMKNDDENSSTNNTNDASEPLYAMTQLLQAVRHLLLNHQKSISTATNKRWLMELFSRECIQQLCDVTTSWAPPLQNYKEVVGSIHASNGNNITVGTATTENDMHHHVVVGIEARRLLFLLLVDIHHSPLLRALHDTKTNLRPSSFESTVVQVILVKALIHLVLHSNHDTFILEVHRFVLYVINLSPTLLPTLLRMVPIPVDDSKRRPFIVLSRLSLMSSLLRYGPRAIHCFDVTTKLTECNQESIHDDTIVLTVLPMAIKKQILVKLLQNTNSLIALEAFKLLVIIIRRCRDYFLDLEHLHNAELETKLVNMISLALPDLPTLTLVVSKLSATIQDDKSKIILLTWACEAVRAYRSVFTRTTLGSTSVLDVSKLLPISAKMFLSSPTVVQLTTLSTIKHFITIQEVNVFMFCCMLNFQTLYTLALTHNDALPQIYICSPARISNLRY
jgi:hypothetical protein